MVKTKTSKYLGSMYLHLTLMRKQFRHFIIPFTRTWLSTIFFQEFLNPGFFLNGCRWTFWTLDSDIGTIQRCPKFPMTEKLSIQVRSILYETFHCFKGLKLMTSCSQIKKK